MCNCSTVKLRENARENLPLSCEGIPLGKADSIRRRDTGGVLFDAVL